MELQWIVNSSHKSAYKDFMDKHRNHGFVQDRIDRNVNRNRCEFTKQLFWEVLLGCFLTTLQRSGKGSKVDKFYNSGSPILTLSRVLRDPDPENFSLDALDGHGFRFARKIAGQVAHAAALLDRSGWNEIQSELETIFKYPTVRKERSVARFLQMKFKGLGPKQSRNLIQALGFSRYEIPLDSRMQKVLPSLGFPLPVSPRALADENYYCFVEDAIQTMMNEIEEYPCVFDACVFASLENIEDEDLESDIDLGMGR